MLDNVKRYREHLAAVVLAIVAVNLVLGIVGEVLHVHTDGVEGAMRSAGGLSLGLVSVLCVLLTVGLCCLVDPLTRHARLLAQIGAVLVTLGTLIALVNLVGGLMAPSFTPTAILEAIGGGTDIALKTVAAFVLWLLARRTGTDAAATPAVSAKAAPSATEIEPAAQPTWGRDAAAGTSWQSAREAAGGGQPANWGNADRSWQPARSTQGSGLEPVRAPETGTSQGLVRAPEPSSQGPVPNAPAQPQSTVWGPQNDALSGPAAKPDRSLWNPSA